MQPNIGSDFDNFLVEEGIREEVEAVTIPKFASLADEAAFWDTHDLTDFGDMKPEQIEFTSQDNQQSKKKSLKGRE
jgi:hypothetical protein